MICNNQEKTPFKIRNTTYFKLNNLPFKLKIVCYLVLYFCPLFLLSQGQYLKLVGGTEYAELYRIQFKETFNTLSFENPVYEQLSLHGRLFGMSFLSSKENNGLWEIGFLIGGNGKNFYYFPKLSFDATPYATENRHNFQLNFGKSMFRLNGQNKNFHFGLCFNTGYRFNFNELVFTPGAGKANMKKVINQLSLGFYPKARLQLIEKLHIEINTLIQVFQIWNEFSQMDNHSLNILRLTNYGNFQFNFCIAYQIKGNSVYIK